MTLTKPLPKRICFAVLIGAAAVAAAVGALIMYASAVNPSKAVPAPAKSGNVQMYLNNAPFLTLSDTNPCRADIESGINLLSSKPEVGSEEFCFDPDLTVIDKNGDKFEYGLAVTSYPSPDVEGAESIPDTTAFYMRSFDKRGTGHLKYYAVDSDIKMLQAAIRNAVPYEYKRIGSFEGVVTYIGDGNISLFTEKYGYIPICTDDAKSAIVGDTISARYIGESGEKNNSAKFKADITNITNGDVTKTSPAFLTALPFSYEVLTFEGAEKLNIGYPEVVADRDELEFTLWLYRDSQKMPPQTAAYISKKYDKKFFEDNILLYDKVKSSQTEVKAAIQANWTGDPNILYIKEGEPDQASLVMVAIPRKDWDEEIFELYSLN